MPSRSGTRLRTFHRVIQRTLVVDLGRPRRTLSSAPRGGGFRSVRYILNHQVATIGTGLASPAQRRPATCRTPCESLGRLAARLGVDRACVGLMTAVPMSRLVTGRVASGRLWVECFATVGVTNAVRAGEWPSPHVTRTRRTAAGTINLIVITNASLSDSAMVSAVQVATESKTGILRDHAVRSWTGAARATGTGTDAVVVVCGSRGRGPYHHYSGTHTLLGCLIGRVIADCVTRGLLHSTRSARASRIV